MRASAEAAGTVASLVSNNHPVVGPLLLSHSDELPQQKGAFFFLTEMGFNKAIVFDHWLRKQ